MTDRKLTPAEKRVVIRQMRALEAVKREYLARQEGLQETLRGIIGEDRDDIALDTNAWTIRTQQSPEAVAQEMADKLNGGRAAVTEGATDDR